MNISEFKAKFFVIILKNLDKSKMNNAEALFEGPALHFREMQNIHQSLLQCIYALNRQHNGLQLK